MKREKKSKPVQNGVKVASKWRQSGRTLRTAMALPSSSPPAKKIHRADNIDIGNMGGGDTETETENN